ncbi:DUF7507 domain-containing protein [Aeromicrobium flavum]|uniref:DUF7507 domain-containing protein n=1 Tax=Aeromicrobium flavum TaxID=416568 RepID=UPI0011BF5003|nr:DUF11 domain-containing protein [Aeromicrobium flavum]
MTPSLPRRLFSFLFAGLMVAALLAVLPAVTKAAPATAAAGDYACSTALYGTVDDELHKIVPGATSTTRTLVGVFSANVNAVAVAPGGDAVYAMGTINAEGRANLYKYGTAGVFKEIRGLVSGDTIVGGAFNPLTGRYWFETVSGGTLRYYNVDLTATSPVTVESAMTSTTGIADGTGSDLAFDSRGNAYVVYTTSGTGYTNKLVRFTAAQLSTGGAQTGKQITELDPNGTQYPGIGFGSDGYIYVTYGTTMYRLSPTDGSVKATLSTGTTTFNDLGSCATPGVMDNVVKEIVARKKSTDQFTVSLSGSDMTTLSGTTTGTDVGLQTGASEIAGPTLVLPGVTYTITETASAGAVLADYVSTYKCVNVDTGAVIASGAGTTGTMTVPAANTQGINANITCTFTNTPKADPRISLTKTTTSQPAHLGDQVAYTYTISNTGNTDLTAVTLTDQQFPGQTFTCAKTLAVGATTTCTATWTIDEADLIYRDYGGTATVNATYGSTRVTATAGGFVNLPDRAQLKLEKTATGSPARAGETITYAFKVTNTATTTVSGIRLTDPLLGANAVTCVATSLGGGRSTTCTAPAYTVTQADADAGTVRNVAGVSGTPQTGLTLTTAPTSVLSTVTPIARDAQLKLVKSASGTPTKAGDRITYAFVVTNTGNTTVSGVGVNDPLVTGESCSPTTLKPGASATCTSTPYVVTQGDVNAGTVRNTATVVGTPLTGLTLTTDVTSSRSTVTPITRDAMLKIVKSASGAPAKAGDRITYGFSVSNTGNTTVSGVGVNDPLVTGESCSPTTLAPGATAACTATPYVVTQGDVDAGTVRNTAAVVGTPLSGLTLVTDATSSTSTVTPIARAPRLKIVNSASGAPAKAGDKISYSFAVTNTGNTTVTGVGVDDPQVAGAACSPTTLAPGASATCSADQYTVTQGDVDAGTVVNTAAPTGTGPGAVAITVDPTSTRQVTTPIAAAGQLDVALTQSAGAITAAGQTITYTHAVQNLGNVSLADLAVTDSLGTTVSCPTATLAPGASTTCTSSYAVTQADVDAGRVVNTASGAARTPAGVAVADTSTQVEKTIAPNAALTTTLTLSSGAVVAVGDVFTYSYAVQNTGNVTVDTIRVTDTLGTTITCGAAAVAPGRSATCTSSYAVTQADVDAGTVVNTATATGLDPRDTAVEDDSAEVEKTIAAAPVLDVTLAHGPAAITAAGQVIAYTYAVRNAGNVSLTKLAVTDALGTTVSCPSASLAPGATTTCTSSHVVTQADVDAGKVVNTATGAARDPRDAAVEDDSAEVEKAIAASASVVIELSQSAAAVTKAGDGILYLYSVQNSGNLTLDDVEVTDTLGTTITCATTIAPGATILCSSTRALTQADVDRGRVDNTASVTAKPARGADVDDDSRPVVKTIAADPELTTVVVAAGSPTKQGDEIAYTATVENTGNVTVDHLVATDDLGTTYACDVTVLEPGEKATCTAIHRVSQADVDAGEVVNIAAGAGEDPSGDAVSDRSAQVTTSITSRAGLSATLLDSGTPTRAGDPIAYAMTVENVGNVTVDGLVVTDDLGLAYACDVSTVAPGERATCAATYPVTQADVDAGAVENGGSVRGDDPAGDPVVVSAADVDTTIPAAAELETTLVPSGSPTKAGDVITWTATVENTGNVTVERVVVTDVLGNAYTCTAAKLAPGDLATCTAADRVTQAEVNAGEVDNRATGAGVDPSGDPVGDNAPAATVAIVAGAALTVTLDQSTTAVTRAGDTITYAYTVGNTGNVTVDDLTVTDDLDDTLSCDATELAPGETVRCTATYTVTQGDVDATEVLNRAAAAARTPAGAPVAGRSNSVRAPILTAAAVATTLASSGTPRKAGDEIAYTATVENTGHVTVGRVVVTDELGLTYVCDVARLAPGEKATCAATVRVSQADVDAGEVANTATGHGVDPSGDPVSDVSGPDTTAIPADAELTTTVVASGAPEKVGDEIAYTATVENTGHVTVDRVVVFDGLGLTYVCDVVRLAPGEQAICTATVRVSQADVDAGEVANTATGHGVDPAGDAITDAAPETVVTITARPRVTLVDAAVSTLVDADRDGRDSAGDTVTYRYDVRNTGNVSLRDVEVADALGAVLACAPAVLSPGASATCVSGPVPVTQSQVEVGRAVMRASASALAPTGSPVRSAPSAELVTPLAPTPALGVVTRIASWEDVNGDDRLNAGDVVFYAFDVANAGTVAIDGVTVEDRRLAAQGVAIDCPVPMSRVGVVASALSVGGPTLAPGQSTTCLSTRGYVVTAGDVQARVIENSAHSGGVVRRTGTPITARSNVVTSVPVARPKLELVTRTEVEDTNGNGRIDAGDEVTYTYEVTNEGDVTLKDVTVTDRNLAGQGITVTCRPATLAPGETATCTASAPYVVTDADTERGTIVSDATARGEDPVAGVSTGVESGAVGSVVTTEPAPEVTPTPPTEPTEPAPSTEPTVPTEPAPSTEPTVPTDPTVPAEPVEPVEPEQTADVDRSVEEDRHERVQPRDGGLPDAGGPAAAAGAFGVLALGTGLGLVGFARRRRESEEG